MTLGANDYKPTGAYPAGQCTDFGCWRIRNDLGYPTFTPSFRGAFFGNAYTWVGAARTAGISVDGSPRRGDIADFPVATDGAGTFGHVACVLKVNADGTILVEDYNWGDTQQYSQHTVPIAGLSFIHWLMSPAPQPGAEDDMKLALLHGDGVDPLAPSAPAGSVVYLVTVDSVTGIPVTKRHVGGPGDLGALQAQGLQLKQIGQYLLDRAEMGPPYAAGQYVNEP